ncbi:MAG: RNA polymerase sigma factor [Cyclobacteriaceae bacterium]|nr:RNA polymerase sigma factor [Cyclobacteriaceae bacterium]
MKKIKTIAEGNTTHKVDDLLLSLWNKSCNGNSEAFDKLYNELADILYKYGMHLVKDQPLVEDAIHDLFIEIWINRDKHTEISNVKSYFMVALRRKILRHKTRQRKLFDENYKGADVVALLTNKLEDRYQEEAESIEALEQRIRNLVNQLSNQQREVIFLRFYQNLSYSEIAEMLEIDQRHAYNLTSKAFSFLRSHLKFNSFILFLVIQRIFQQTTF